MKTEKKDFINWFKRHKKELIDSGLSITAIIAMIISMQNRNALKELGEYGRKGAGKTSIDIFKMKNGSSSTAIPGNGKVEIRIATSRKRPHDVAEHIRILHEGWQASQNKIATALEHGYDLLPGQTWVEAYQTGGK